MLRSMPFLSPLMFLYIISEPRRMYKRFFESGDCLRTFDKLASFGYNETEGGELSVKETTMTALSQKAAQSQAPPKQKISGA